MDFIQNAFDQLNWWAILVATLSTLPVGYVWYDLKVGFGKPWAKLNGLKEKDLQSTDGMAMTFGVMLATSFATAFVIASLAHALNIESFGDSVLLGILIGLVIRGGSHFIHNGFTRKPKELTLIDAGHDVVSITVMTVILGLWR